MPHQRFIATQQPSFVPPPQQFVAGKPKVNDQPQTLNYREFKFSSFSLNTTGAVVNSNFPLAKKIATFIFPVNAAIIGVSLTSAITNLDANLAGIFLTVEAKQATMDVSTDVPILVCHITQKNSLAGTPVSANRTNGITFSDSTAMKVNASQEVGLYACAFNNASNLLTALAQFVWIPIPQMR